MPQYVLCDSTSALGFISVVFFFFAFNFVMFDCFLRADFSVSDINAVLVKIKSSEFFANFNDESMAPSFPQCLWEG